MGNPFQITEQRVLAMLRSGQPVDMSNGEGTDVAEAASWGPERTVRAEFIRELCLDENLAKVLSPRGLCLARGKIVGVLDLEAVNIPFRISLNQCYCPDPIDLRHAAVPSLDFSGCRTGRINADGITVSADMQLANGFMAEGSVSLIGATVKGNLSCVRGHFDNTKEEIPGGRRCKDCRTRLLCAYALVLERAKVEGSLFLCDGFHSVGGVHLGDARVGVNLNCTSGTFMASIHASCPGGTTGRRLACATESHNNFFCGFNGEGVIDHGDRGVE